jgi:hypothetical protein
MSPYDLSTGGNSMLYIQQYLKTAAPHVFVEYATDVNRYRFVCSKCEQTLTFSDGIGVDGFSVQYCLQKFVKEHVHPPQEEQMEQKESQAKWAAQKDEQSKKLLKLLDEMKFSNPAGVVNELTSAICECGESCPCLKHGFSLAKSPAAKSNTPKTGRKFRQ